MSNTRQHTEKVELDRDRRIEQMSRRAQGLTDLLARRQDPVSYTHLTLPTKA